MSTLLTAFQEFFREHAECWVERFEYKKAGPQLLLQAFLQRIVNSRVVGPSSEWTVGGEGGARVWIGTEADGSVGAVAVRKQGTAGAEGGD
ncbi:MAG: hypothetical protein HY709_02730 [Candidatus Latescibacteria bacterium]|nr:hypothetical protein [Candidatus Latescibacterota bacterium]